MNKYQKALNEIKEMHCNIENCDCEKCNMTPFCAYYECCKTLQELVDKETPKKVNLYTYDHKTGKCPNCGITVYSFMNVYCQICGQALDWSDEK